MHPAFPEELAQTFVSRKHIEDFSFGSRNKLRMAHGVVDQSFAITNELPRKARPHQVAIAIDDPDTAHHVVEKRVA